MYLSSRKISPFSRSFVNYQVLGIAVHKVSQQFKKLFSTNRGELNKRATIRQLIEGEPVISPI